MINCKYCGLKTNRDEVENCPHKPNTALRDSIMKILYRTGRPYLHSNKYTYFYFTNDKLQSAANQLLKIARDNQTEHEHIGVIAAQNHYLELGDQDEASAKIEREKILNAYHNPNHQEEKTL